MLNDERYVEDGVGIFQGGSTYGYGVWRPTEDSIMNEAVEGFNAPSREAIYYRIHKLAYGNDWEYDYDFATYDAINRKQSAATTSVRKSSHTSKKMACPPVIRNKTWKEVVESGRNGTFVIGE